MGDEKHSNAKNFPSLVYSYTCTSNRPYQVMQEYFPETIEKNRERSDVCTGQFSRAGTKIRIFEHSFVNKTFEVLSPFEHSCHTHYCSKMV